MGAAQAHSTVADIQPASMYNRPQLYDDAFSYRDFTAEVSAWNCLAGIIDGTYMQDFKISVSHPSSVCT